MDINESLNRRKGGGGGERTLSTHSQLPVLQVPNKDKRQEDFPYAFPLFFSKSSVLLHLNFQLTRRISEINCRIYAYRVCSRFNFFSPCLPEIKPDAIAHQTSKSSARHIFTDIHLCSCLLVKHHTKRILMQPYKCLL